MITIVLSIVGIKMAYFKVNCIFKKLFVKKVCKPNKKREFVDIIFSLFQVKCDVPAIGF